MFEGPLTAPRRQKLGWHKRPSIFMPRHLARLALDVVSVRVERLQEIGDEDIVAEGGDPGTCMVGRREWFKNGWDTINGKRGPWASNPFVWRVEFRRLP